MCGICGDFRLAGGRCVDRQVLQRMIRILRHRGPDDFGMYIDDHVGLAHARLSIIDVSGGGQPIANEDRSVWIVYNGEVFNFPELREDLEKKGHRFATRTDTEVIVHLYEERGEDFLTCLNGQFALALWDKKRQKLILARDRMGIRPLFYTVAGGSLLFASEAKSLFVDPRVKAAIDPVGLDQFFTFWATLPPRTTFKDISELPPAHYLVAERGAVTVRRYWELRFPDAAATLRSEQEYADELYALLMDATRIRLRADVPVASYLSGGIDSSFISAIVKKHFNDRLQTFSVSFADRDYDESRHQQAMADFLGTEHRTITCTYADIGRIMPTVVWHAEKPLVRTAPAPLYMLAGLVRANNIKVVLTGEGADEVLAGYDLFREARIRRFWARNPASRFRSLLLKEIYQYVPNWPRRAPAYLEAFYRPGLLPTATAYYSHIPRWETTARAKRFFSREMKDALAGYRAHDDFEATLPEGFGRWDPLAQAQYIETVTLLSGNLLSSQGDRMMMGNSVEGRLPFLDYRVVEFCAALPPQLKLKVLTEKYLLKRVARPLLPAAIIERSKQAYRAPDSASFFDGKPPEYVGHLLSREYIGQSGYFDHAAVSRLAEKCSGTACRLLGTADNIAMVGVLTTLLADYHFIRHFRDHMPDDAGAVRIIDATNENNGGKPNEDLLQMRLT